MHGCGATRADCPGGDARALFRSVRRVPAPSPDTRLQICHDDKGRGATPVPGSPSWPSSGRATRP